MKKGRRWAVEGDGQGERGRSNREKSHVQGKETISADAGSWRVRGRIGETLFEWRRRRLLDLPEKFTSYCVSVTATLSSPLCRSGRAFILPLSAPSPTTRIFPAHSTAPNFSTSFRALRPSYIHRII
jgi:hypothetical protein